MPDSKILIAEASISKASISNNHIASCITELLAKQLNKEFGDPPNKFLVIWITNYLSDLAFRSPSFNSCS